MKHRLKLAGIAALAAAMPAFAQVKLNDVVSVTGWATGSYQYTSPSPGASFDSFNLDAAYLEAIITPTKTMTANVSLYYRPTDEGGVNPSGGELTLLDANVAWAGPNGITITGGKFVSYLGYESFYLNQDNMITLANQQFLAPIPGYHEGVKIDYSPDKTMTMGAALLDSLYPKPGYNGTEGDGELKHNGGAEGYFTYTGINNFVFWAGIGYDSKGNYEVHDVYVYDVWATYQILKNLSVAAEEIYKDGGDVVNTWYDAAGVTEDRGSNWLGYVNYNFTDKIGAWGCVSGEDVTDGPSYVKYSVSPFYTVNNYLTLKAQYSYTKYRNYTWNDANFLGVQAVLHF